MPSENVQLLRELFDAWNRGDIESILEHLSPDWEYRTAQLFPGIDPVYHGKEGFKKFSNTLRDPWESISMELEHLEDLGDRALTLHTFYGRGRASGVEVTLKYANIFTFRDGLISRTVGYGDDWPAALEAAGLSETSPRGTA